MSKTVPDNIEDAPTPIEAQFPGLWWNGDRREARFNRVDELRETIPDADCVGIVDTDSDGRACEVVLNAKYDNPVVIAANGGEYGIRFTHALNIVKDTVSSDTPVIVADLSPDSTFSAYQASLANIPAPVSVYDHHDWNWTARTSIENVVEGLYIDEDKCAAQVLQSEIYPEADDQLREFLDVTADHDLWVKEDPRSDHLSTLSFKLSREDYIEAALEHGADMLRESKELQGIYGENERKSQERARIAVENAEWKNINGVSVALTYLDCHQSRVGDQLIESGADLAVIIQPTLSLSFRSTEEFDRCADLARGLNGGGHQTAAGASIYHDIEFSDVERRSLSADEIHIPEIEDSPPKIDEHFTKHQYVWRTGGEPAIETVIEYLESAI